METNDTNDNVVNITKNKKPKELPKHEQYRAVADRFIENRFSLLPEPKQRLYIAEPKAGIYEYYVSPLNDGILEECTEEGAVDRILNYCQDFDLPVPDEFTKWTIPQAKNAFQFLRAISPKLKKIQLMQPVGTNEKALFKLGFTPKLSFDDKDTECFDFILSRCSNPYVIMAFIGSLFYPESDRSQYLWIRGQGLDGKGALIRLLQHCLGRLAHSEFTTGTDSPFWTTSLLRKRIVIFPDCNDSSFPTTQLFKSLSGGDPIRVEPKFEYAYTAQLECKFLFCSNNRPKISAQKSDRRRLLYAEIASVDQRDVNFEERLFAEAPYIIGRCMDYYIKTCPHHEFIPTGDDDVLDAVVYESEMDNETLFDTHFKLADTMWLQENKKPRVTSIQMSKVFALNKLSTFAKSSFLKWLEATHGIKYKQIKVDGRLIRGYIGIEPKIAMPINHYGTEADI